MNTNMIGLGAAPSRAGKPARVTHYVRVSTWPGKEPVTNTLPFREIHAAEASTVFDQGLPLKCAQKLLDRWSSLGFFDGKQVYTYRLATEEPVADLEALKRAYPNLAKRNTWLIFSRSESISGEEGEAYGYWNNEEGWSTHEGASGYFGNERKSVQLPISADASWVRSTDRAYLDLPIREFEMPYDISSMAELEDMWNQTGRPKPVKLELHGIEIRDGVPVINDRDPQLYVLHAYGPGADEPEVLGYYTDYQLAFVAYYRLGLLKGNVGNFACGDMDHWFMLAATAKAAVH